MKIEEYAKQFEYVVCSKADALAEGIRIGLKAAIAIVKRIDPQAPKDPEATPRSAQLAMQGFILVTLHHILSGERDLPEVGE